MNVPAPTFCDLRPTCAFEESVVERVVDCAKERIARECMICDLDPIRGYPVVIINEADEFVPGFFQSSLCGRLSAELWFRHDAKWHGSASPARKSDLDGIVRRGIVN